MKTREIRKYDLTKLYDQLKTHSGVFRFLRSEGMNYYQISKITGKRPQHVRNVLITPLSQKKS